MNKIYCFGDGFAANHIWPEWPDIISALYPELDYKNFGAVGAGNEFIASAIIKAHTEDPSAFFIVQWALPNRFDKLLEDSSWNEAIARDPIYHFNTIDLYDQRWWLSSGSNEADVQKYHTYYVQPQQSLLRTNNYKYLVDKLLQNQSVFFSTSDMDSYSRQYKFIGVRQHEIQPSPWIHINYLEDIVLPNMPIQPEKTRIIELKNRIQQHTWVPYDPDRKQIWLDMINF
jgi:hypothetical protein